MKANINDFVDRKRKPQKPIFTERDWRILEDIWEFDGVLADYHIRVLEFADNTTMLQTKSRMSRLFNNGYVHRLNRAGWTRYGCNAYWLTKAGAEIVAGRKNIEWSDFGYLKEPRWAQLQHDFLATDFTLTLLAACQLNPEIALYQWFSESHFRRDPDHVTFVVEGDTKPTKRNVIPDRFFHLIRQSETPEKPFHSRILLELDHATHPNKRFAIEKVIAGTAYLQSEVYKRRFNSSSGRWLVVTTTMERLKYLKATTEAAVSAKDVSWYFTTFDRVQVDTVLTAPIWLKNGSSEPVALFPPR